MRVVQLREFQQVVIRAGANETSPADQYVTQEEADLIQKSARRYGCTKAREWFAITRNSGASYLKAGCWVGVICAGDVRLEVLPKIGTEEGDDASSASPSTVLPSIDLIEMLVTTGRLPRRMRVLRGHQAELSVLDVMIQWYVGALSIQMGLGLLRGYQETADDIETLRGRLDFSRQWRNTALRRSKVACQYDEFSFDTPLNRILKSALKAALELSSQLTVRSRIRSALQVMEQVSDEKTKGNAARRYILSPRESRFSSLHAVACFLLDGFCPDPFGQSDANDARHLKNKSVGSLINMEKLYEQYVYRVLTGHGPEALSDLRVPGEFTVEQQVKGGSLGREMVTPGAFKLIPDLVISRGKTRKPVMVADTKWKQIKPPVDDAQAADKGEVVAYGNMGVKQSDVYQLFAYSEYYGSADSPVDVVLIYPSYKKQESRHSDGSVRDPLACLESAVPEAKIWRFCPQTRQEGVCARLHVRYFPLPLIGPKSANSSLQASPGVPDHDHRGGV